MSSESANLIELYNKYEINLIKNKNLNDDDYRETQSVNNKVNKKVSQQLKRHDTMSVHKQNKHDKDDENQ